MGGGSPTLTGVTLNPPGPVTMYDGDYLNFTATAHYSDGSTEALGPMSTASHPPWLPATFGSSDETVATVNSSSGFFGRVYSVAPGAATITVQMAFHDPSDPTTHATADITVTDGPAHVVPNARFSLAFGHPTLQPYPDWTAIDAHPNLVTSYSIDRGRSYELDQTGGGTATVQITDRDGILDPTNPAGAYYGQIRPMLQALICRHDPVTDTWEERYRGFVEDFAYEVDASQQANRLTVSLVDLFDIIGSAQMQIGQFGTTREGQMVYSAGQLPGARILQILGDTGIPTRMQVVFRGNVHLQAGSYSPGESPLTAIQETVDAEFPGVGNLFCDRHGRISFHGRHARFNPPAIAALEPDWDYHHWKAGDGAAVNASPSDTAQARAMSFQRGVSKIINTAIATEQGAPDDTTSRQVTDSSSVNTYGMRAWSSTNLLTNSGDLTETYSTNGATETKRFAQFYVSNYAQPRDRISQLTFKSLHPSDPRAAANWLLLSQVDISDTIEVTVATPGGGGFTSERYFVEGIHEQTSPLIPDYDDVTVTLDLSPRSYYGNNPWQTPLSVPDDPAGTNPVKKPSSKKPGASDAPKPSYHGSDHGFTGPDPIPIAYDNVGTGTGGGAGGGIQFDADNEGGWLYVQVNDETEVGGSIHGYALDLQDHSSSSFGIRLKTFSSMMFEAATDAMLLSHGGEVTIESDRSDVGDPFPTPSIIIKSDASGITITGRTVDIKAGGATGLYMDGSGSLALPGNVSFTGSTDLTASGNTFGAATFNGSVLFDGFVECHSAIDVNGIATFGGDTEFDAKVGFYGNTPIAQPAHPSTLTDVITALVNLGLVAP
jgi:hypothetical protein